MSEPKSKTRHQEGYGMGEVTVTRADLPDLSKRRDVLETHPLFKGVGRGTIEAFREKLRKVTIQEGQRLTRHSAEDGSPRNSLWLADQDPLKLRLNALSDNTDENPGVDLGVVELDASNLRSWFGGISRVPTHPGMAVTSAERQRGLWLPSLAQFYNPNNPDEGILTEDVMRLLMNTGGIFSQLMSGDNRTEIAQSRGFHPHSVPTVSNREMDVLRKLPGARVESLEKDRSFTPDQERGFNNAHAIILSGRGWFFDRQATREGMGPKQLLEAGIMPIAQLGDPGSMKTADAFAFQWAALNTGKNTAQAVFIPSTPGTTALWLPIGNNIHLLHRSVDSIAEMAASMHEHVAVEGARLEAEKPVVERALGFLRNRFAGLLS